MSKDRVLGIVDSLNGLDVFIHSGGLGIMVCREQLSSYMEGHDDFDVKVNKHGINIFFN